MKQNKSSSLNNLLKKAKQYSYNKYKSASLKFKESLKSESFKLGISKTERYIKVLENFNQFKNFKKVIREKDQIL